MVCKIIASIPQEEDESGNVKAKEQLNNQNTNLMGILPLI